MVLAIPASVRAVPDDTTDCTAPTTEVKVVPYRALELGRNATRPLASTHPIGRLGDRYAGAGSSTGSAFLDIFDPARPVHLRTVIDHGLHGDVSVCRETNKLGLLSGVAWIAVRVSRSDGRSCRCLPVRVPSSLPELQAYWSLSRRV
jgi:hypothetical protein